MADQTPTKRAAKAATSSPRRPPAYRQRKGYTQAIVTLTDAVTKRRKDYWLGEYGSPESRELYYGLLAEYLAASNGCPTPFVWTKSADDSLDSVKRFCLHTSDSGH